MDGQIISIKSHYYPVQKSHRITWSFHGDDMDTFAFASLVNNPLIIWNEPEHDFCNRHRETVYFAITPNSLYDSARMHQNNRGNCHKIWRWLYICYERIHAEDAVRNIITEEWEQIKTAVAFFILSKACCNCWWNCWQLHTRPCYRIV